MEIKYLGTGAAEGIPAVFCNCPVCIHARSHGKKEIRTRTQALVDGKLLIDFPADSYIHMVQERLDLSGISHLLITHSHDDHLYPMDLLMRLPDYGKEWKKRQLHIYGNRAVVEILQEAAERYSVPDIWNFLVLHEIIPFEKIEIEGYDITALPARHMETEEALLFLIEKEETAFLYGNDTGLPGAEFWRALMGKKLDGISLDCTMGRERSLFWGHMGYQDILAVKERMERENICGKETVWVINHFSHNGNWMHREMETELKGTGVQAAYDGMVIRVGKGDRDETADG